GAPNVVMRLFDDRWAQVPGAAFDLKTRKMIAWPTGAAIGAVATAGDRLWLVATIGSGAAAKLELFAIAGGKLTRTPIAIPAPIAVPVGLVVDRADRVTIALADGRIVTRTGQAWAVAT